MNNKSTTALPTERLDEALVQCAIPGFWGDLTIDINLRPTAATEVDFHIERKMITQVDTARSDVAIVPSNERVKKVRNGLLMIAGKLRLECPVSRLVAKFRDGHLYSFEIAERVTQVGS